MIEQRFTPYGFVRMGLTHPSNDRPCLMFGDHSLVHGAFSVEGS